MQGARAIERTAWTEPVIEAMEKVDPRSANVGSLTWARASGSTTRADLLVGRTIRSATAASRPGRARGCPALALVPDDRAQRDDVRGVDPDQPPARGLLEPRELEQRAAGGGQDRRLDLLRPAAELDALARHHRQLGRAHRRESTIGPGSPGPCRARTTRAPRA